MTAAPEIDGLDACDERVAAVHDALREVRSILRATRSIMADGNIVFGGLVSVEEQRRVRGIGDNPTATARLPDRRKGPNPSQKT